MNDDNKNLKRDTPGQTSVTTYIYFIYAHYFQSIGDSRRHISLLINP